MMERGWVEQPRREIRKTETDTHTWTTSKIGYDPTSLKLRPCCPGFEGFFTWTSQDVSGRQQSLNAQCTCIYIVSLSCVREAFPATLLDSRYHLPYPKGTD